MKQIALLLAVTGLAITGCAQNRVLGTHARRGGAHLQQVARKQSAPKPNIRQELNNIEEVSYQEESKIKLAMFGKRKKSKNNCCDDTCCDSGCCEVCETDACCGCPDECCASDACCCDDGCCDSGCCDGCSDGCCSSGGCGSGGCSSCGGQGCGLCQRMVGRVASGFCPHSGGYPAAYNYNPSPPSGQVAYPYYTVRGPRDFLRNNPPSIGPY